jgi:hypothetical protein
LALQTYGQLLRAYTKEHGDLVKPRQGWDSLCDELHLVYSMFRQRGYTDLGTYVDKPLDHGGTPWHRGKPAWAFDVGRSPSTFWYRTWGQVQAWAFCRFVIKNHKALNVEYLIFRDRIWSRDNGWRPYTRDRSHFYHIHVSGHWPGR